MRSKLSKVVIKWDKIVIFLLLLQVFIIQWLGLTYYHCIFMNIILVYFILKNINCLLFKLHISVVPFLIYLLYYVFQFIRTDSKLNILYSNFFYVTTSLLVFIALCLLGTNKAKLKNLFIGIFPYVNIYMVINIPILLLQMNGHVELSGKHAIENTNYYNPDLISGLFGYNGTPMLAVFSAFFFVYDLWYYRNVISYKNKKKYLVYYFIMFAFFVYISGPNQNNGYFVVLALFFILYYLSVHDNYQKLIQKVKHATKGILLACASLLTLIIGYRYFKPVSELIDKLTRNITVGTTSIYATGSAERFAMITYYFQSEVNKPFGVGIGVLRWRERLAFGFKHFGQSDMGAFLLVGGFVFVVLLVLVFANAAYSINRSRFITFFDTVIFLVLIIFTQLLTNVSIMISFSLFILTCSLEKSET